MNELMDKTSVNCILKSGSSHGGNLESPTGLLFRKYMSKCYPFAMIEGVGQLETMVSFEELTFDAREMKVPFNSYPMSSIRVVHHRLMTLVSIIRVDSDRR